MMMAITKRIWINPPKVYDVTTPKSQRINNMTAIVYNILISMNNSYEEKMSAVMLPDYGQKRRSAPRLYPAGARAIRMRIGAKAFFISKQLDGSFKMQICL